MAFIIRSNQVLGVFVLAAFICHCAATIEDEDTVYRALIPRLMSRVDNLEAEFSKQKRELQESKENQARLEIEIQKLKAALEEQHISNQALRDQVVGNTERQARLQRHMTIIRNQLAARKDLENHETVKESPENNEHIMEKKEKEINEKMTSNRVGNTNKILSRPADDLAKSDTKVAPHRNRRFGFAGIAFSAYLDHDVDGLGPTQAILFNQIHLNDGNAYNVHTGAFTCPTGGVYLFSFGIASRGESQIAVKLTVNSTNMADGVADSFHQTQDIQGGNLVILKLTRGDAVIVEAIGIGTHMEGSAAFIYTTFSGTLLYAV